MAHSVPAHRDDMIYETVSVRGATETIAVRCLCGFTAVYEHTTCEHGLSADLCAGPQHYPYDEGERAYYS